MRSTLVSGAALLIGGAFLAQSANAQCPKVGADSGCGVVINITGTGAALTPPALGPYDSSDDTLVGVTNNIPACVPGQKSQTACGISIYSLDLSSTQNIFGFDGDGISSSTYGVQGNARDASQYGGPNAYFTNINGASTTGRVNFIKPIAPGKTDYFSLENSLGTATACADILKNSLKGATGTGSTPAPTGNMPNAVSTVGIRATFVPQGTNPSTGKAYTLAEAATVCGFLDFNWQQTITRDVTGIAANCPPTPLKAPPNYIDPPACGYQGAGQPPPHISPLLTYWDSATTATGAYALATNKTANYLSFQDAPNDPSLPAGEMMKFQTELVGLQGATIATASVVPTGILFTWTSDHKGAAGGTHVTLSSIAGADTSGTGGTTVVSATQTSTYIGSGVTAINGSNNVFSPTSLLSSVLPASRSAQPNGTITAFATVINSGSNTATSCSIAPASTLQGTFTYQTTDPKTNALTGTANTAVNIPANGTQTFVIAFTPTATLAPADVAFNFTCTNSSPAPINSGLNTLLLSASTTTATPDVIALVATLQNDGIVHATGATQGFFAVATDNLGSADTITVGVNTGTVTLPLAITLCQSNPTTGVCMGTPSQTVTTSIGANTTPTFVIFVSASNNVAFDPANNRIFVTFTDSTGAVRGETSVAVETQ